MKFKNLKRFEKYLKRQLTVGMPACEYIESLIRPMLQDKEYYLLARRAYVSFLRAYARLPLRDVFVVKKLNLSYLAKSFGLSKV